MNFGHLGSRNDTVFLKIPSGLTNFYQEAFARQAAHRQAYAQLQTFIDYLNEVETREFPGWDAVYYVYTGGRKVDREELGEASARVFAKWYAPYTCRILTVLQVQRGLYADHLYQDLDLRKLGPPFEYNDPESTLTARACLRV